MAQDCYKINGVKIFQPDMDVQFNWEKKYSESSDRTRSGRGSFTQLFIVDQFTYTASHVPIAEAAKILKAIRANSFAFHVFHPLYAKWMDVKCYVSSGDDCTIGSLEENHEYYTSLSFNATAWNGVTA